MGEAGTQSVGASMSTEHLHQNFNVPLEANTIAPPADDDNAVARDKVRTRNFSSTAKVLQQVLASAARLLLVEIRFF